MRFAIMVTGPAYGTQQSSSALQFVQALLNTKHQLVGVFFYQEGVYNANQFTTPASDEFNVIESWQLINKKYNVELHVCISAALRRGIIDNNEAKRLKFIGYNLADGFALSRLSVLAKIAMHCDRLVQF